MSPRSRSVRRRLGVVAALMGLLMLASVMPVSAQTAAAAAACRTRTNDTIFKLTECVTVGGVRNHQRALQGVADANGGVRASGLPGYTASVDYVVRQLQRAGYSPTLHEFDFAFFQNTGPATLEQTAPTPTVYVQGTDFDVMTYSGSGDVAGAVQAVDLVLPPGPNPSTSNSGCEAADFASFTPGNIALIQRGTCTFEDKANNAQAAGATAVIIFNEGQPGRTDLLLGTLGNPETIPVLGTTFDLGNALAATAGLQMHVVTQTISEIRQTQNITAELAGSSTNVVQVGAHLDSVTEGPGINDNGSGSATILEVALQMHNNHPVNTVRFSWWGAEELGLLGSQAYVDSLSDDELARIVLYLNFDMVGSPNFVRFVYDGDESTFPESAVPIPPGSAQIERRLRQAYRGLAAEDTAFDGRSDYEAFALEGIPAGGLFTGAEGIKTDAQAAVYGGTAGVAYDPCYHQACDTYTNVSTRVLDQNSDAIAQTTLSFSQSVQDVIAARAAGAAATAAPAQARVAGRTFDVAS